MTNPVAGLASLGEALDAAASRPDPRTVLLGLLSINILVLANSTFTVTLLCSVVVVFLHLLAHQTRRATITALLLLGACAAFLYLPRLFTNGAVATIAVIAFWGARFGTSISAGVWAISVLRPDELIASLRALHIPNAVVIPLAVVFRILPTILTEGAAIIDAMTLRGIRPTTGELTAHPLRTGKLILIPLLSTIVRIGDELAAAAMVRGLGSTRPTSIISLKFRPIDALVLITVALVVPFRILGWEIPL